MNCCRCCCACEPLAATLVVLDDALGCRLWFADVCGVGSPLDADEWAGYDIERGDLTCAGVDAYEEEPGDAIDWRLMSWLSVFSIAARFGSGPLPSGLCAPDGNAKAAQARRRWGR